MDAEQDGLPAIKLARARVMLHGFAHRSYRPAFAMPNRLGLTLSLPLLLTQSVGYRVRWFEIFVVVRTNGCDRVHPFACSVAKLYLSGSSPELLFQYTVSVVGREKFRCFASPSGAIGVLPFSPFGGGVHQRFTILIDQIPLKRC